MNAIVWGYDPCEDTYSVVMTGMGAGTSDKLISNDDMLSLPNRTRKRLEKAMKRSIGVTHASFSRRAKIRDRLLSRLASRETPPLINQENRAGLNLGKDKMSKIEAHILSVTQNSLESHLPTKQSDVSHPDN